MESKDKIHQIRRQKLGEKIDRSMIEKLQIDIEKARSTIVSN